MTKRLISEGWTEGAVHDTRMVSEPTSAKFRFVGAGRPEASMDNMGYKLNIKSLWRVIRSLNVEHFTVEFPYIIPILITLSSFARWIRRGSVEMKPSVEGKKSSAFLKCVSSHFFHTPTP